MAEIPIKGFKVLLQGDAGTGKTYSIGTLIDTGLKVGYLCIGSEIESLFGYYADRGKPVPSNFAYHILESPAASWAELIDGAEKVNQFSYEMLAKMTDPNRTKQNQFINLLKVMSNFVDQRTGEVWGPVDKWSTDRVLVVDPMTAINSAVMSMVIGIKPVKAQHEWGIAQDQIEKFIKNIAMDCKCHFVLLAHVEKETDQIQGGLRLTLSTLGKALPPKIPPMFSDVIYTWREVDKFWWSTANSNAVTKTRNLPIADKIVPDFGQILRKWTARRDAGIKI